MACQGAYYSPLLLSGQSTAFSDHYNTRIGMQFQPVFEHLLLRFISRARFEHTTSLNALSSCIRFCKPVGPFLAVQLPYNPLPRSLASFFCHNRFAHTSKHIRIVGCETDVLDPAAPAMNGDVMEQISQIQLQREAPCKALSSEKVPDYHWRADLNIQNVLRTDQLPPRPESEFDSVSIDSIFLPEVPEQSLGHVKRLIDTITMHYFSFRPRFPAYILQRHNCPVYQILIILFLE